MDFLGAYCVKVLGLGSLSHHSLAGTTMANLHVWAPHLGEAQGFSGLVPLREQRALTWAGFCLMP